MTLIIQARIAVGQESVALMHAKLTEAAAVYITHPGCLGWEVMVNTKNPLEFSIVETYTDAAAIDYHRKSDYYTEFFSIVRPISTNISVEVYETLSAPSKL